MLVIVGFMMSTVLMNLFIGVLTVSYEIQARKSSVLFSRFRASAALEAYAIRRGWRTLRNSVLPCCVRNTASRSSWGRASVDASADAQLAAGGKEDPENGFMWVSTARIECDDDIKACVDRRSATPIHNRQSTLVIA